MKPKFSVFIVYMSPSFMSSKQYLDVISVLVVWTSLSASFASSPTNSSQSKFSIIIPFIFLLLPPWNSWVPLSILSPLYKVSSHFFFMLYPIQLSLLFLLLISLYLLKYHSVANKLSSISNFSLTIFKKIFFFFFAIMETWRPPDHELSCKWQWFSRPGDGLDISLALSWFSNYNSSLLLLWHPLDTYYYLPIHISAFCWSSYHICTVIKDLGSGSWVFFAVLSLIILLLLLLLSRFSRVRLCGTP